MKEYWEILRELREDRDLRQADIAAILGTTQQVYSRYEKGINELPVRHLKTLCMYYGVSADYVLSLNKDNKKR
ncbi:MAG: helix-turn-helix transcriptional regulator [Clostridiales bacterium]|nr:helix-turn-helix transcriptional regulator [Clostridiales bacterium]